jgi:hypothetical protein
MKKYMLLFFAGCTAALASAQDIRLNGYCHYVFDDQVESYYSNTNYFNGIIEGGTLWGLGLEFKPHPEFGFELLYLRQDTKAYVHYYDLASVGDRDADIDLGINWIMAGFNRTLSQNEKVEPYAGMMLGVAIIDGTNPENKVSESATKFGWGVRLGTNVWLSDKFGLKFQAQLLCATQAAGGGIYFGTGGTGAGVTTYSTMAQFALGGGIAFKFGGGKGKPATGQ